MSKNHWWLLANMKKIDNNPLAIYWRNVEHIAEDADIDVRDAIYAIQQLEIILKWETKLQLVNIRTVGDDLYGTWEYLAKKVA